MRHLTLSLFMILAAIFSYVACWHFSEVVISLRDVRSWGNRNGLKSRSGEASAVT